MGLENPIWAWESKKHARGCAALRVEVVEPVGASATELQVPLTAAEAAALQGLMRAVGTEGTASFLGSVTGAAVMAKTGTAEYGTTHPPAVL